MSRETIHFESRIPPSESWWITSPPRAFTARAWQEYPRMRKSKFAAVSVVTLDSTGLAGPSKSKDKHERRK